MIKPSHNRFGLSRSIPADVKRQVRQNSQFGCVLCRVYLVEYAHIDPPFVECKEHDVDNICLLCPTHHSAFDKGHIPREVVRNAYEQAKSGKLIDAPYFKHLLTSAPLCVNLGNTKVDRAEGLIRLSGEDLVTVTKPEQAGGPPVVSGVFFDEDGKELLRIVENEWIPASNVFDVETSGSWVTVRRERGRISLKLGVTGTNEVTIERLDMRYGCTSVSIDNKGALSLTRHYGNTLMRLRLDKLYCIGAKHVINIDETPSPRIKAWKASGGGGMVLEGTGISLATGGDTTLRIYSVVIEQETPSELRGMRIAPHPTLNEFEVKKYLRAK